METEPNLTSLITVAPNGRDLDLVALGEILLRLDPENDRITDARSFTVYDGGAEYNVARNLAKVFQLRTAIVTALADNEVGRLAENFAKQSGVDTEAIIWRDPGGDTRNGLYFMGRGFGVRAPASTFDRDGTAVSKLTVNDIDWVEIFRQRTARWFHTGGVFSGLSPSTPDVAAEAIRRARESGAIVSFDLNYRDSLWKKRGGRHGAEAVNRELMPMADVVFGVFDFDAKLSGYSDDAFRSAAEKLNDDFPNLKFIATTLRNVKSASRHDLSGVCYTGGKVFKAADRSDLDVFDRVGSGDAFASGIIHGLLAGRDPRFAIECGVALAAQTMTTAGDGSSATLTEVETLMSGSTADVQR